MTRLENSRNRRSALEGGVQKAEDMLAEAAGDIGQQGGALWHWCSSASAVKRFICNIGSRVEVLPPVFHCDLPENIVRLENSSEVFVSWRDRPRRWRKEGGLGAPGPGSLDGVRCESTRTFVTRNTWEVAVAVTRCGTLRVSWQAHMAGPSPAEARASPPDGGTGQLFSTPLRAVQISAVRSFALGRVLMVTPSAMAVTAAELRM